MLHSMSILQYDKVDNDLGELLKSGDVAIGSTTASMAVLAMTLDMAMPRALAISFAMPKGTAQEPVKPIQGTSGESSARNQ